MRVFITGATGFIGTAVVQELIATGHEVLGLSRSEAGVQALSAQGAQAHRGSLEDLDSLRDGAAQCDGVIHAGFIHDFSKFKENCEIDRKAILALGETLAGSNRPLIVTSGLGARTEDEAAHPPRESMPRVSEQTALQFVDQKVRVSVMRLPQVHDTVKQGLITYTIAIAREKGVSAYVGDGQSRFPAVHCQDAARLYRLALENGTSGAAYHAIAEEGVPTKEIAEAIGRGLNIPVVSQTPEEAMAHFGWLGWFMGMDMATSSTLTRERLHWQPNGPSLMADLARMDYAVI